MLLAMLLFDDGEDLDSEDEVTSMVADDFDIDFDTIPDIRGIS